MVGSVVRIAVLLWSYDDTSMMSASRALMSPCADQPMHLHVAGHCSRVPWDPVRNIHHDFDSAIRT